MTPERRDHQHLHPLVHGERQHLGGRARLPMNLTSNHVADGLRPALVWHVQRLNAKAVEKELRCQVIDVAIAA